MVPIFLVTKVFCLGSIYYDQVQFRVYQKVTLDPSVTLVNDYNHTYCNIVQKGKMFKWVTVFKTLSWYQGRNMVYPGPIDPYFLAIILIPEPW